MTSRETLGRTQQPYFALMPEDWATMTASRRSRAWVSGDREYGGRCFVCGKSKGALAQGFFPRPGAVLGFCQLGQPLYALVIGGVKSFVHAVRLGRASRMSGIVLAVLDLYDLGSSFHVKPILASLLFMS